MASRPSCPLSPSDVYGVTVEIWLSFENATVIIIKMIMMMMILLMLMIMLMMVMTHHSRLSSNASQMYLIQ